MLVELVKLKRNLILPKADENYNRESNEATTTGNQRSYGEKKCCYLRERERERERERIAWAFWGFYFLKLLGKLRNNNYSLFIRNNYFSF